MSVTLRESSTAFDLDHLELLFFLSYACRYFSYGPDKVVALNFMPIETSN